jgi:pimeloyl-ACP methyl ester carboxylesterase
MIQHFIDKLGIKKYTLMGASYGGLISAELAIKYPDQVERLILVDAAMKYIYEDDTKRICDYFDVENISELFVPSKPDGLKRLYYVTLGKDALAPPIVTLRRFHEELYQGTFTEKQELVKDLLLIRESYGEHIYRYKVPVHLIWGDMDVIIPAERAVKLRDHIGGDTTLDIIKKGGHMPNMNKPRIFNNLLKKYLKLN